MDLETITFKGAPMATKDNEIPITRMPLNKIKLGRNSRANIDKDELEGLMESIKSIGLLQPIGVVKNGTGYDIAYGNRRFLACSKLGLSHVPVIVHTYKKASEVDIKNLAENVQRKNISLIEAGRYVSLLLGEGLTKGEIATRLGTSRSYVNACEDAFQNVPKAFRADIVAVVGSQKKKQGKISTQAMTKIINVKRTHRLNPRQESLLYEAAKTEAFAPAMIGKYAVQLKQGNEKFLETVEPIKHVRVDVIFTQKEYDRIWRKFIDEGIFKTVPEFLKAILTGKKAETVKIVESR